MTLLEFSDLRFVEKKDENLDSVRVYFLKIYYFDISKKDLQAIADFKLHPDAIEFDCSEKRANTKFNHLLSKGFDSMVCSLNNTKTIYVHQNSGIPLLGTGIFGIIDRNTNCIEIKPITNCNLDCIYCSVNAGLTSRKQADFVVEKDYLIEEFNKLAEIKKNDLEVHIGPQGEPFLYSPLVELVKDLKKNPKVKVISIDTNATLLTKKLIDDLAKAGMTRINVSLNALNQKKCSELAGMNYNLDHVLEMLEYAKIRMNVLVAPVLIPGMNDEEIEALVKKGKSIISDFPTVGIQNFLNYKRGRNPVKQRTWDQFFEILKPYEKKHNIKLKLSKEDFHIETDEKLEKPFKKRQIIKARIICEGPLNGEKIGVYKGRAIIIEKAYEMAINSEAKVLVIRDKHNIFRGVKQ